MAPQNALAILIQLAKVIGDIATGQVADRVDDGKNPAAVESAHLRRVERTRTAVVLGEWTLCVTGMETEIAHVPERGTHSQRRCGIDPTVVASSPT